MGSATDRLLHTFELCCAPCRTNFRAVVHLMTAASELEIDGWHPAGGSHETAAHATRMGVGIYDAAERHCSPGRW